MIIPPEGLINIAHNDVVQEPSDMPGFAIVENCPSRVDYYVPGITYRDCRIRDPRIVGPWWEVHADPSSA